MLYIYSSHSAVDVCVGVISGKSETNYMSTSSTKIQHKCVAINFTYNRWKYQYCHQDWWNVGNVCCKIPTQPYPNFFINL